MKCLIVYDTRMGTTETIARRLAQELGGDAVHLPAPAVNVAAYDLIVVGTPQPFSQLPKPVAQFLAENREHLAKKKSGLFLTCASEDDGQLGPVKVVGGARTAARLKEEYGLAEVVVLPVSELGAALDPARGMDTIRQDIARGLPAWDARLADFVARLELLVERGE